MGFGSRNQVAPKRGSSRSRSPAKTTRIDEVAQVVADQRDDAVVSGDECAAGSLVAVAPFRTFAAQQHALRIRSGIDAEGDQVFHRGGLRRTCIRRGGRRSRAVAVADVENRVAERTRSGDVLARPGTASASPAPPTRPSSSRCSCAVAQQPRLEHRVVEHGFVEIQHHGGGRRPRVSAGTLACLSAALPGTGATRCSSACR